MFTTRGKENRERIHRFIVAWTEKNHYPPSIREIAQGVGIASTKAVKSHIDGLVNAGLLRRRPRRARALELPGQPFSLPLVGRIAAGQPGLAIENVEENVSLSQFKGCFMLRVKGDSMVEAGILDSDIVIVQPQELARNGEIVVALVDNDATVKRFYRESGNVVLKSANARYQPIAVGPGERDFRVVGRVVGVLRRYQ
jgi:repressor LexA